MSKGSEEPKPEYDKGGFLQKGECIINKYAAERVLTKEQWDKLNDR